jgi:MFS family permease
MVAGLTLQAVGLAWLAVVLSPTVAFATLVAPFVLCGVGMSLFFVPVSNMVLGSVRASEEGVASGANNAVRELGGVIGIAVLASVFASRGSYASGAAFVAGTRPAILIGALVVAGGAVAASLTGGRSRQPAEQSVPALPELAMA